MQTKKHSNKLQKSSVLFLPLGLVLTLLTVYGLLESKTANATIVPSTIQNDNSDPYEFTKQVEIQIERTVVEESPKEIQKEHLNILDEIKTTDDQDEITTEVFDVIDLEKNPTEEVVEWVDVPVENNIIENVPFILIEDVPIFPGCEKKKDNAQRKACFTKNLSKFIGRKFNTDLAQGLGLSPGKKKIWVQFTVTSTGDIIVNNTSAPHVRLEKEGKRIVELLPKMIPGKQRKKPVNVIYMLPIIFQVD